MNASAPLKVIRTLLLVEDDDDDEFLFRRALRRAGFATRILRISSGAEALDYFYSKGRFPPSDSEQQVDLVFMDIKMPGTSGFDVLAKLKIQPPKRRPFIAMLTSSGLGIDRERAVWLGADCYLVKPVTTASLAEFATAHGMQWA